jgi:hypothetical protein
MSLGQPSAFCLRTPLVGTITLSHFLSAFGTDPATEIVCIAGQENCNVLGRNTRPLLNVREKGSGWPRTSADDLFARMGLHRVSSLSMKHGDRLSGSIQARYGVSRGHSSSSRALLRPKAPRYDRAQFVPLSWLSASSRLPMRAGVALRSS